VILAFSVVAVAGLTAQGQPRRAVRSFRSTSCRRRSRCRPAPLLIGAYVFVLVALGVYLLSLARRLTAVQREVSRLEHDLKQSGPR
jgi:CcmD family protein